MGALLNTNSLTTNLSQKNNRLLEQSLDAFAHRFPVSGRIVHALAQEFGGVMGLAECMEKHGIGDTAATWLTSAKPQPLRPEEIRNVFSSETLDLVSQHLAIPRESVEIQAALGIPKFFNSIGLEEEDLDFNYSAVSKKKSNKGKKRPSAPPP